MVEFFGLFFYFTHNHSEGRMNFTEYPSRRPFAPCRGHGEGRAGCCSVVVVMCYIFPGDGARFRVYKSHKLGRVVEVTRGAVGFFAQVVGVYIAETMHKISGRYRGKREGVAVDFNNRAGGFAGGHCERLEGLKGWKGLARFGMNTIRPTFLYMVTNTAQVIQTRTRAGQGRGGGRGVVVWFVLHV